MSLEIFYGVLPEEKPPSNVRPERLIHLGFYIGQNGRLFSPVPEPSFTHGVLNLTDKGFDETSNPESTVKTLLDFCEARHISGVYLDFTAQHSIIKTLERALTQRGIAVFVPACLSDGLNLSNIIFPSDVTSGFYHEYIENLCKKYPPSRLVLEFSPLMLDYGADEKSNPKNLVRGELFRLLLRSPRVSFSDRLCTCCFTLTREDGCRHNILFDDRRSLEKKTEIAAKQGITRIFMLAKDDRELPE